MVKMRAALVNNSSLPERLHIVASHLRTLQPQRHGMTDTQWGDFKQAIGKLRSVAKAGQSERAKVITRIRELAPRLRELALKEFETHEKPILEAFAADLKPNGRGVPLAALSVSELGTSEVKFTQLIRYFLDPKAPHGLGSSILQSLIEWGRIKSGQTIPLLNYESAEVTAEVSLGGVLLASHKRRHYHPCIDLVVCFPNFFVLIEHKINSDESVTGENSAAQFDQPQEIDDPSDLVVEGNPTQLEVYWSAAQHNWKKIRPGKHQIYNTNSLRIFLTPTGKQGKRENAEWLSLTHESFVNCILDESRRIDSQFYQRLLSNRARHNLACFLWDLTQGPVMRDQTTLKKLEGRIDGVVSDPASYFRLRRWCEAEQIEWQVLIKLMKLMEVDYAETDE